MAGSDGRIVRMDGTKSDMLLTEKLIPCSLSPANFTPVAIAAFDAGAATW